MRPVLEAVGTRTVWLDEVGRPSSLKLASNAWVLTTVEGIAKSLTSQKTRAGIAAARSSTAQRTEIIPQVDDEQEDLPSACDGWRVIDVVAHLAVLASEAVETSSREPPPAHPGAATAASRGTHPPRHRSSTASTSS